MFVRSLDGLFLCGSYELGEERCLSRVKIQSLIAVKICISKQRWCRGKKNTGQGSKKSRISSHVTKGKLVSPP